MSEVTEEIFMDALSQVVCANSHWIPPIEKYYSLSLIIEEPYI